MQVYCTDHLSDTTGMLGEIILLLVVGLCIHGKDLCFILVGVIQLLICDLDGQLVIYLAMILHYLIVWDISDEKFARASIKVLWVQGIFLAKFGRGLLCRTHGDRVLNAFLVGHLVQHELIFNWIEVKVVDGFIVTLSWEMPLYLRKIFYLINVSIKCRWGRVLCFL